MPTEITPEMQAALELIRKEKAERAAAFEAELRELVIKYKVDLGSVQIRVLDIDIEREELEGE